MQLNCVYAGNRRIRANIAALLHRLRSLGGRGWLTALALALAGIVFSSTVASATCTVPNTLTNGQATDANQVMANFNSLLACINTTVGQVQTPPQGRLTLTSNTPVMTADATAQSTIYYAPYQGNQIPVAGTMYSFNQISYSLSSSAHLSGSLYDVFAYYASGAVALCTGPAWSSGTVRAAAISMSNGIWGNQASLTCTNSGGGSAISIAANNATYLGTFYATANGQTGMAFKPSGVSGGTNNVLGLWNAYNRVPFAAFNRDTTVSWTKTNSTWASLDASNSNRVTFVDGLAQSTIDASVIASIYSTANSATGGLAINLDSTSATPNGIAVGQTNATPNTVVELVYREQFLPVLGLHFLQAMQSDTSGIGTVTYIGNGDGRESLMVSLMM